jgi:hypothetical protein
MAIQASSLLLWSANSSGEMSLNLPPHPVRSSPEFVSRIQSINERPGFSAVLFRGLPEYGTKIT